jgi:outer membrane protein insertion porin family
MRFRQSKGPFPNLLFFFAFISLIICSCHPTKHLKEGEYLLRRNNLNLKTDKGITRRGELKDNIERLIVQKPNTYLIFGYIPYKVWFYNLAYKKLERDPTNYQKKAKTVEKPVVFDSTTVKKSVSNIRSYLFNQGYFYPIVKDTVIFKNQKAFVNYNVETGLNFLIKKTTIDVDDSAIYDIVNASMDQSVLKEGNPFAMSLLEQERSRIANVLRDRGYYKFTQENIIDFKLDTLNKDLLRDAENPFESAINFLALQKKQRKPTLDIRIFIRTETADAYKRYVIHNVTIYPDFISREDARDSSMLQSFVNGVKFRYHNYYIRENVILKHTYLEPGKLYSQSDYDATINKLNQLGVFQTIRVVLVDDTATKPTDPKVKSLNCFIVLNPAKKFDFTLNLEFSTGTTYTLGVQPTVSFRNHNLGKGANLLTTSVGGGLESIFDKTKGDNLLNQFRLITKTLSINASLDMPKFLVPFKVNSVKKNLPRTVIRFGTSLLDRIDYFTLTNYAADFSYNWKETENKTWDLTPSFVNIIRLPKVSDSFQKRLDNNEFLKNSYRETFIEGENITYTFNNQQEKKGRSYTFMKFGLEEAGGLMGGLANFKILTLQYSQYIKFDFDVRRYINYRRSQIAGRFYGGVGVPYGESSTLPYVKQYFVGGAYSIRGWRIRSLGPGSYFDPASEGTTSFIDRTGDMKLEMNGEFRFDMVQLFSGALKLRGALFADAGNIWLVKKSSDYPDGDFRFDKFGNDIALSVGAGARIDFAGFFIIRFDAATPVKSPYNSFYNIGGWSSPFRKTFGLSDLVLNIAIGYPF